MKQAILLILLVAIGSLCHAQTTNLIWTTNANNTINIVKTTNNPVNLVIPDTISGLPVTSTSDYSFTNALATLSTCVMPNSLTNLGISQFYYCTNLKSCVVSTNLKSTCINMFYACFALTNTTLPYGLTNINNRTFYFCSSLTNLTIPETVLYIDDLAVYATGLKSITIPNSVTALGLRVFSTANSLTNVVIGTGLTNVGVRVFDQLPALQSIYFYGNAPNVVTDVGSNSFNSTSATAYILGSKSGWPLAPNMFGSSTNGSGGIPLKYFGQSNGVLATKFTSPTNGFIVPSATTENVLYTNLTTWLTGVGTSNTLYDFSKATTDVNIVQSPCLTFDGVGDYITIPTLPPRTNITVTTVARLNATTNFVLHLLGGESIYTGLVCCVMYSSADNSVQSIVRGGTTTLTNYIQASSVYSNLVYKMDGGFHTVSVTITLSNINTSIDGVAGICSSATTNTFVAPQLGNIVTNLVQDLNVKWIQHHNMGGVGSSQYGTDGIAETIISVNGSNWCHYVFTETQGTNIYDVSGNGRHGVITTTSGLSTMWSVKQDVFNYFANYGGSIWTNGLNTIYVPNVDNGGSNAVTNVVGYVKIADATNGVVHNMGPYSLQRQTGSLYYLPKSYAWLTSTTTTTSVKYSGTAITDYIVLTNAYNSMSNTLWTNTVLWVMADAPVYNYGKTNYYVRDFSANNATLTQPTPAKQPPITYTNGYSGFLSDTNNSYIISKTNFNNVSLFADSNETWSVVVRAICNSNAVAIMVDKSKSGATIDQEFMFGFYRPYVATYTPIVLIRGAATALGVLDDGSWHHYAIVWNKTNVQCYVDGSFKTTAVVGTNINNAANYQLLIGSSRSNISTGSANVASCVIFNKALTSNEVSYLYTNVK